MELIKAIFSLFTKVVYSADDLATTMRSETVKIRNESINNLVKEQSLDDDTITQAKKLLDQRF